jgi:hypothetical protein
MAITKNANSWFGLSTDTKPTSTLAGQLGSPLTGDTFRETDTGKNYIWIGTVWMGLAASTVSTGDANGNALIFAQTPGGYQMPITPLPDVLLSDNFNGTTIDTVYRWQTPVTAAGGTMTQAGGALVTTLGTTASAAASITSIENFEPSIGNQSVGTLLNIEAAPATNTNRCFGFYTKPGSFTAATPVQDGYVWEYDITGTFGASIYSGGTRISRTTTNPLTGLPFFTAGADIHPTADFVSGPERLLLLQFVHDPRAFGAGTATLDA